MSRVLAEQKIALEMDDYLKLLPHKHQTDGFFAAVLERKPLPPRPPKAKLDDEVDEPDADADAGASAPAVSA